MKHPQKMSFQGLVINAIIPSSNLNHTCPYDVRARESQLDIFHYYIVYLSSMIS